MNYVLDTNVKHDSKDAMMACYAEVLGRTLEKSSHNISKCLRASSETCIEARLISSDE